MATNSYFSFLSSKEFHSIDEVYAQVLEDVRDLHSGTVLYLTVVEKRLCLTITKRQLDRVLNDESRLDLFRKNVIDYYQHFSHMSYEWVKNTIMEIASYTKPMLKQHHADLDKLLYDYGYGDHSITKEHEIELLKELCKSDSYFAEAFGKHFEQMKSNILNDFPILHQINLKNV